MLYTEEEIALSPLLVSNTNFLMGIFSSGKEKSEVSGIPKEFFQAVTVMNEGAPQRSEQPPEQKKPVVPAGLPVFEAPKAPMKEVSAQENKPGSVQTPARNPFLPVQEPGTPEKKMGSGVQVPPLAQSSKKALFTPLSAMKPEGGFLSNKIIWLISGVVLLALFAGIVAFIWFRSNEAAPETPSAAPETAPAELSSDLNAAIAEPEAPFSVGTPNYLLLNTETATPESIRAEVSDKGRRMLEFGMTEPVEFLITDQNNNPLAFTRFAFLADLSLPSDFLDVLDESFTLWLYNDGGTIRQTLAITSKGELADVQARAKADEALFPRALTGLFYGKEVSVPAKTSFREGSFNGMPVRYVNIDEEKNYSMDYFVDTGHVFVANSKNALRTTLEKTQKEGLE